MDELVGVVRIPSPIFTLIMPKPPAVYLQSNYDFPKAAINFIVSYSFMILSLNRRVNPNVAKAVKYKSHRVIYATIGLIQFVKRFKKKVRRAKIAGL